MGPVSVGATMEADLQSVQGLQHHSVLHQQSHHPRHLQLFAHFVRLAAGLNGPNATSIVMVVCPSDAGNWLYRSVAVAPRVQKSLVNPGHVRIQGHAHHIAKLSSGHHGLRVLHLVMALESASAL
jgi:hypothetical protein